MKQLYGTHVYSYLRKVREAELVLRLQQMYTADEVMGIINEIHNCEEHCYTQPGFTIIYSGIEEAYALFVTLPKFSKLTDDIGVKFCKPPKSLRTNLQAIQMWDGTYLDKSDIDYIMNCKLICKENPRKAAKTNAGLIWKLVKTLVQMHKKLMSNIKLKEEIDEINSEKEKEAEIEDNIVEELENDGEEPVIEDIQ